MKTVLILGAAVVMEAAVCLGQASDTAEGIASLIERERAFAKASVEKGSREAFLEFFADNGIVFRPHPVVFKEAMKNVPPPANPLAETLNWEPIFVDVSQACDLGYTTGPYALIDNTEERRPTQHGYFFSIWKRQAGGNWKVVLDLGIRVSEPYQQSKTLEGALASTWRKTKATASIEEERKSLLKSEREFLAAGQVRGMPQAFLECADADIRVYREGEQPIVGRDSARASFLRKQLPQTWEPIKADVAQSGDIGYTYGSYEIGSRDVKPAVLEKGYYVRIWKRNAAGGWKIVFDGTSPLPTLVPESKQ